MNDTFLGHRNKEENKRAVKPNYAKNKFKNAPPNKGQKRDPNKPKVPRKISPRYLHNSGLAYLQRFATSSAHFKVIMTRKIDKSCRHHTDQSRDDCIEMLDALIPKFQDLGLLDDDAYIRGVVTSSRRRGFSQLKIKQKLMQKGVENSVIEQAVKSFDESDLSHYYQDDEALKDGDLNAAIIFARKKKLGAFDIYIGSNKEKDKQKSLAQMARAGFSYGICEKVLSMPMEDIENQFSHLL